MGQEFDTGYFGDPDMFPYPDDPTPPGPDMPSELGGTVDDWYQADAADPGIDFSQYGGSYTSEESGPVAGPDLQFPNFPGLPDLGGLLPSGGGLFPWQHPDGSPSVSNEFGGNMGDDFDASSLVPYSGARGVPWGPMIRQVASAARYFGPQLLMPIVNLVAQYWSARTKLSITPGALLMKFLTRKGKGRRSRGITGRQLSITARTIGKVERMHQRIRAVCSRAGVSRHYSRAAPARHRRHRR